MFKVSGKIVNTQLLIPILLPPDQNKKVWCQNRSLTCVLYMMKAWPCTRRFALAADGVPPPPPHLASCSRPQSVHSLTNLALVPSAWNSPLNPVFILSPHCLAPSPPLPPQLSTLFSPFSIYCYQEHHLYHWLDESSNESKKFWTFCSYSFPQTYGSTCHTVEAQSILVEFVCWLILDIGFGAAFSPEEAEEREEMVLKSLLW